jgi:hypothetical protein
METETSVPESPNEIFDLICDGWENRVVSRYQTHPFPRSNVFLFYERHFQYLWEWTRLRGQYDHPVFRIGNVFKLVHIYELDLGSVYDTITILKRRKLAITSELRQNKCDDPTWNEIAVACFLLNFLLTLSHLDVDEAFLARHSQRVI